MECQGCFTLSPGKPVLMINFQPMSFPSIPTDNVWKFLCAFIILFQIYSWHNYTGNGAAEQMINIRNKLASYGTLFDYATEKKKDINFLIQVANKLHPEEETCKLCIQLHFNALNKGSSFFPDARLTHSFYNDTTSALLNKRINDLLEELIKIEDEVGRLKVPPEELKVYEHFRSGWLNVIQLITLGLSLIVFLGLWNHKTQRHEDRLLELKVKEMERKLEVPE